MQIELVAETRCLVGESPVWHADEACVYWVDIVLGKLFRFDPAGGRYDQVHDGLVTGGLTVQDDGSLLMFQTQRAIATYRDGRVRTQAPRRLRPFGYRYNDVIADPLGGVFCGVMPYDGPATGRWNRPDAPLSLKVARRATRWSRRLLRRPDPSGRLIRIAPSGEASVLAEGLARPNGMGFTPDRTGFYFTDSLDQDIHLYDFDARTGALSNRRRFAGPTDDGARPDGLTVDAEGFVWSGQWNGGALLRRSPSGKIDARIPIPARNVTSLIFGGEDYTDIYVTTAATGDPGREGHHPGGLFRLSPGIRGLPEFRSTVRFGDGPRAKSNAAPDGSANGRR